MSTKTQVTATLDKIIMQDFFDAYKQKPTKTTTGKTNLREYLDKIGVYIILEINKKTKEEQIVYVGMSSYNLYATISRHFQKWKDASQNNRVSYRNNIIAGTHDYKVCVALTTAKTSVLVEKELTLMYEPRDNKQKIDFYSQKTDKEVLEQFGKFLKMQYGNRKAQVLKVLRNPDKYTKKAKKKAFGEFTKIFKFDGIKTA